MTSDNLYLDGVQHILVTYRTHVIKFNVANITIGKVLCLPLHRWVTDQVNSGAKPSTVTLWDSTATLDLRVEASTLCVISYKGGMEGEIG